MLNRIASGIFTQPNLNYFYTSYQDYEITNKEHLVKTQLDTIRVTKEEISFIPKFFSTVPSDNAGLVSSNIQEKLKVFLMLFGITKYSTKEYHIDQITDLASAKDIISKLQYKIENTLVVIFTVEGLYLSCKNWNQIEEIIAMESNEYIRIPISSHCRQANYTKSIQTYNSSAIVTFELTHDGFYPIYKNENIIGVGQVAFDTIQQYYSSFLEFSIPGESTTQLIGIIAPYHTLSEYVNFEVDQCTKPQIVAYNSGNQKYFILVLPNGASPSSPLYKGITEFSIAWMKKNCWYTIYIPSLLQQEQHNLQIPIESTYPISSLIFGDQCFLTMEKHPIVDDSVSIKFPSISEFIQWVQFYSTIFSLTVNLPENLDDNTIGKEDYSYFFGSLIQKKEKPKKKKQISITRIKFSQCGEVSVTLKSIHENHNVELFNYVFHVFERDSNIPHKYATCFYLPKTTVKGVWLDKNRGIRFCLKIGKHFNLYKVENDCFGLPPLIPIECKEWKFAESVTYNQFNDKIYYCYSSKKKVKIYEEKVKLLELGVKDIVDIHATETGEIMLCLQDPKRASSYYHYYVYTFNGKQQICTETYDNEQSMAAKIINQNCIVIGDSAFINGQKKEISAEIGCTSSGSLVCYNKEKSAIEFLDKKAENPKFDIDAIADCFLSATEKYGDGFIHYASFNTSLEDIKPPIEFRSISLIESHAMGIHKALKGKDVQVNIIKLNQKLTEISFPSPTNRPIGPNPFPAHYLGSSRIFSTKSPLMDQSMLKNYFFMKSPPFFLERTDAPVVVISVVGPHPEIISKIMGIPYCNMPGFHCGTVTAVDPVQVSQNPVYIHVVGLLFTDKNALQYALDCSDWVIATEMPSMEINYRNAMLDIIGDKIPRHCSGPSMRLVPWSALDNTLKSHAIEVKRTAITIMRADTAILKKRDQKLLKVKQAFAEYAASLGSKR